MEESHRAPVYTIDGTLTPISPFFPRRQMKEYISLLKFPYFHFSILSKLALPTNTFTKIIPRPCLYMSSWAFIYPQLVSVASSKASFQMCQ